MSQQNDAYNTAFKQINIIYMAVGAAMLLTISVFYYLVEGGSTDRNTDLVSVLTYIVPMVGVSGYLGGNYLYGLGGKKSKEENDIIVKLTNYRKACITVWALLEGPALFAGVAYFLTGDQLFLGYFGAILAGFLFQRPTIDKFKNDF